MTHTLDEVLGPDGLLAGALTGFNHRPPQLEMARAVERALAERRALVVEAGTGTGKTFAYLVPALLADRKIIISTGTRNLQDQLYLRDLPRVADALHSAARVTLLKGRANYLCVHRLERTLADDRPPSHVKVSQLRQVREWSTVTDSGDIAECREIPEDAPVWPLVTSTTDNCLGQECPRWDGCHLVEARRRAQEADIVVVNHHLLCADLALKEEGFGELLPDTDAWIVDEAHQLPDIASDFFGTSLTSRQLHELTQDARREYLQEAGDLPDFEPLLDRLATAAQDLRLAFGAPIGRGDWSGIASSDPVQRALDGVAETLTASRDALAALAGRGRGLDSCRERAELLLDRLTAFRVATPRADAVNWYETFRQSVRLNRTPLDIAPIFRQRLERHPASWIFTSATLAVGASFAHFCGRLGLDDADTGQWSSPFDYPHQALWFVPRGMPDPGAADYTGQVSALALELVAMSRGRAFLLFTSHRALAEAAAWLAPRLAYPMLVQGSAPKAALVEQFIDAGDAVLLGTASFWEGVDVRGDALSLVLIDKLPFASPGDPVLKARLDAIRRTGGNPFMDLQVPQAAIALKQGAGRLIRDAADRGVLVTCDPRLLRRDRPYGKILVDALPPFARTRDPDEVARFFAAGARQ